MPFTQGELLHDKLEEAGCDVTLLAIEGADPVSYTHLLVQLDDEAVFLKNRDKAGRGDHSVDGVIPANQHLGSDDTLGPDIEERLKIGDKVAVF